MSSVGSRSANCSHGCGSPVPEGAPPRRATEAGYDVVVAAAPEHVAAVREYLIDDLGSSQELGGTAPHRCRAWTRPSSAGNPDAGLRASPPGDGASDGRSPDGSSGVTASGRHLDR